MDVHQLKRTSSLINDFLIEHSEDKFTSFDLTDNHNQIQGDSYKFPIDNSSDIMYFLKYYKLDSNITEQDILNLREEKGYYSQVYLILTL